MADDDDFGGDHDDFGDFGDFDGGGGGANDDDADAGMFAADMKQNDGEDDDGEDDDGKDDDNFHDGTAQAMADDEDDDGGVEDGGGDADAHPGDDTLEIGHIGIDPENGRVNYITGRMDTLAVATDAIRGTPSVDPQPENLSGPFSPISALEDDEQPLTARDGARIISASAPSLRDRGWSKANTGRHGTFLPPIKIVTGDQRRTRRVMTRYELARIVGDRATYIEHGATDIDERVLAYAKTHDFTKSITIAMVEVLSGLCPMHIMRSISATTAERWNVSELILPHAALSMAIDPHRKNRDASLDRFLSPELPRAISKLYAFLVYDFWMLYRGVEDQMPARLNR